MAADLSKFGIGHEHPGEKKAWIEKQELTDKNDYFKESASFWLFSASFCEI